MYTVIYFYNSSAAEEEFPSLQKLAAVEPNKNMRRLGKFLTNYLVKEIIWVDSLTMIPGTGVDRGKFDISNKSFI